MAAVTPVVYTPIHDEEAQYQSSSSEQVIKKCIRNLNFLGQLQPIGKILLVNVNQAGAKPLDSNIWQPCDGSEITNPQSPLRSMGLLLNFVPSITDYYVRAATAVTGNSTGGSQSFSVGHDHGAVTGGRNPPASYEYEADGGEGSRRKGGDHSHVIQSGLGTILVDYPQWLKVGAFLKIQ